MACQITNNSNLDTSGFEDTMQQLVSFSQDRFGFENPPALFLNSDPSNASDPLGKTAYYDPENKEIHIYVDERHPKDIMRSISHELIHHVQNLRGDLSGNHYHGEGYAQKDEHMREMEREAYEQGNLCFRDFEDKLKLDKTTYNEWRTNKMSLKEWKNNELFTLLSGKWGFGKNTITEGAKPFDNENNKDEKCDYVDCDNEKKLGESNCGDHDEKLEEGEETPEQKKRRCQDEMMKGGNVSGDCQEILALEEGEVELQVNEPNAGATMADISEGGMKDLHSEIEEMLDDGKSVEEIVAALGVSKYDVDGVKQDMTTAKTELKEAMRKRFARLIK